MGQSLSTNECQAEVAFTVLAYYLRRLHPSEIANLRKETMEYFADVGDPEIIEEAKAFFKRIER